MKKIRSACVAAAVIVSVAGCVGGMIVPYGLQPGVNTMKDVRNRIGMPSRIYHNAEGNEVWEYNNNPSGYFAYQYVFDDNNVMQRGRRIRVQDDQWKVRSGMTSEEVVRVMGEPSLIYYIRGSRHWEWRVHRAGSLQHRMITQFDREGRVLNSVFVGSTYRGSNAVAAHGGVTP